MMRELIEKGFLIGLGALTLTREKAQSIVDELVKRGDARRDEAKDLVDRLVKRGEEEHAELRKLVKTEVENAMAGMSLVTREDIEALAQKIDGLTEKLESK
jgi:polyhydroxyalkanoate synthesis regulator phasin